MLNFKGIFGAPKTGEIGRDENAATLPPISAVPVADLPHLYVMFWAALGVLTAVRVTVLFVTPLELYPDEAQYWLWSRHLAFGYFSKPPLIAWLIRATTALGGQGEAWVRLSAPLLHGGAAVALAAAGRRLYSPLVGVLAAAIYSLAPGVQLSCAVIATDAPLMLCLCLALWAYAGWWRAADSRRAFWCAAGFGLALGAAFLAKYAALYFVGAALLHAVISRDARGKWSPTQVLAAVLLFLAVASPNILWNAAHHFQTVAHTADNANLGEDAQPHHLFDPRGSLGYVAGQFGVFGPIPFAIFLLGVAGLLRQRTMTAEDKLLLAFAAPPLLIVLGEAIVSRANANWAGAAYGPTAILVAAILVRKRAWRTLGAVLVSQIVIALIFLTAFSAPMVADWVKAGNSFKRAKGWAASTTAIRNAALSAGQPLSAVAVDDRFLFNALSYYGRDNKNVPAGSLPAPLKMWVREARPHNQAETNSPLTDTFGARVFVANAVPHYTREIVKDFGSIEPGAKTVSVSLDAERTRTFTFMVADKFRRRPRDPVTGRPILPRP